MRENPEPSHDILRPRQRALDVFFAPRGVAVIGATETPGSVGRTVLSNLISTPFGGTVFPINPKRGNVLGIKAYPSLKAVPGVVELAVVVTPAPTVPALIGECLEAGVKGAIIISAGFRESGESGAELERQVHERLRGSSMRVVGPNCLGVMSPRTGLNATFAAAMARPGNVAFISQSGALLTAILDWSLQENIGFSAFVSMGSMLDVGWGDMIDHLCDDPHTRSIVLYMESIGDARSFLSAAREATLRKPVIVIKAGRTQAAAKAAASHTGTLTGSDDVLDAAFRRSGVLRVNTIADVFHMSNVLSKQPRPQGQRLAILTNAGGPAVLATDALIAGGGELAQLSHETTAALNELLPPQWSHSNPIDILGDADPQRYARAVDIAARDANSDGLLVILTPQAMTDPTQTAEHLKSCASTIKASIPTKPILASWMGGAGVQAGQHILSQANIPIFPYPDTAARVFNYMWRYSYNLRGIFEVPKTSAAPSDQQALRVQPGEPQAGTMIQAARQAGRTLLTELESKRLLGLYGIATVDTRLARSADEAVCLAESIGYPVVLKLHSYTITHKTEVGGVQLNLADAAAVRRAHHAIERALQEKKGPGHFDGVTVQPMVKPDGYELILGSSIDAQFGPVLLFGTGGQLVEVFQDRSLALPPLTRTLARRMMEQTRIYTALEGVRGRKSIDMPALEQLLVDFSQLVVEQPAIKEIDINPLLASSERLLALDARVVLFGPDVADEQLPRPVIRPYPSQYAADWKARDGSTITIRPIRPEDEPLLVRFHETLSEQTLYLRYIQALKLSQRVAHERLSRLCFIDYDREMALVAERKNPATGDHEVIAVGRLIKLHGTNEGEFALLVSDPQQKGGLGTEILRRLVEIGRLEGLRRIIADILPHNTAMQRVCTKLGFHLEFSTEDDMVKARLELC
jgi:acetyltransferase